MKVVDRKRRREKLKNKIKNQANASAKGLSQIKNAVSPSGSRSENNNNSTYVRNPNSTRSYDRFRASRRFPEDIEYEESGSKPKKKATASNQAAKKKGNKTSSKNTKARKKQGSKLSISSKPEKKTQPAPPPSSLRKRTPEMEQRYQELLGPGQTTEKKTFSGASLEESRNLLNGVPAKKVTRKKKGKKSNTTFSTGRKRRSGRLAQVRKRHKVRARRIYHIFLLIIGVAIIFGAVLLYQNRNVLISRFIHNTKEQQEVQVTKTDVIDQADLLAEGYDYDGAIAKLKTIDNYEEDSEITDTIKEWETVKQNLVEFKAEDVTHIFYHTLVRDTELAFECEPQSVADDFKEWMTTIDEFDKITQTMYDEGYVLCSLYDFFDEEYDEDGTPHFTEKSVYLPEGKKPFVLSVDDLSYYHVYTGHGMATKLVLDENGKITCEYENTDGSVETGSFDCVPRLNDFLEKHPDGAYHGARGTIALTGYNGVFGYRTDQSYVTQENLDADKKKWLEEHPDFDYDEEVANAKQIAEELKAEGWDFASHTWGHIRIGNATLERIQTDTEKWLENVEPIIGETECIIFAHGQDIASSSDYDTDNNEKYQYLVSKGFHIFLNVDSYQKTMSVHDLYVHGGRRDLDGYRLWSDAYEGTDWTSDLFDAKDIVDSRRTAVPTPTE